jgi:hypothetical protein
MSDWEHADQRAFNAYFNTSLPVIRPEGSIVEAGTVAREPEPPMAKATDYLSLYTRIIYNELKDRRSMEQREHEIRQQEERLERLKRWLDLNRGRL